MLRSELYGIPVLVESDAVNLAELSRRWLVIGLRFEHDKLATLFRFEDIQRNGLISRRDDAVGYL